MFKGSTEECFKHLMTQMPAPGTRDVSRARRPMTEFLGIQDATIRRWMSEQIVPVGLVLVKLRFMLEDIGYEVKELTMLPTELYNLGQILAYDVMKIDEVAKELGYDVSTSYNSVYRLVQTGADRLGAKLPLVQGLWAQHELVVQRERQKWRDTFENLREAVDRSTPGDNVTAFPGDARTPAAPPATRTAPHPATRTSPLRMEESAPVHHEAVDTALSAFGHSLQATAALTKQMLDRPVGDRRIAIEAAGGRRGLMRFAQDLLELAEEGN